MTAVRPRLWWSGSYLKVSDAPMKSHRLPATKGSAASNDTAHRDRRTPSAPTLARQSFAPSQPAPKSRAGFVRTATLEPALLRAADSRPDEAFYRSFGVRL